MKMKQLKTILCSLPFVFAAVGCSQDELTDAATGGSGEQAQQVTITFDMGAEAEVQTRSAVQRPVISSDNWQRVTDVCIYAFVSDELEGDANYRFAPGVFPGGKDYYYVDDYAETKKDWKDDDVWGDSYGETKDEQYSITVSPTLKNRKYYKFLAIGRDDISKDGTAVKSENALRGTWSTPAWNESTTLATASLMCNNGIACSEMFSGCSEAVYIKGPEEYDGGTIELKRIVAGMMMYLKNVPSQITPLPGSGFENATKKAVYRVSICPLQHIEEVLVAQDMTEGDGISAEKPGHGKPVSDKYRSNKYSNGATNYPFSHEYVSVDVHSEESNSWDIKEDKDGYLNSTKGNGLLAGNFVLPQDNSPLTPIEKGIDKSLYLVFWTQTSRQDLRLEGTDTEGGNINIARNKDYRPIYWIPIKIEGMDGLKAPYKFPILGNHFYSLGTYNKEKNEDQPIDLSKHNFGNKTESIVPALRVISPEEWPDILKPASTN